MFSNLTHKKKQGSLLVLTLVFFILGIYQITASPNATPIPIFSNGFVIAIAFWASSRCYSAKFIEQYALENAITRDNNQLIVKQAPIQKVSQVDITRISQITIADNYFSCILDNNGQGYDFQIIGKACDIELHLASILTASEREAVIISLV